MQGIYRIINKVNDKRYIGSTNNFEKGWKDRLRTLKKGKHHNPHLQRAWNKYGEKNFVFEIVNEVAGDNAALLAREQIYLDEGFALGILYNIAKVAGGGDLGYHQGMLGKTHTNETKDKIAENNRKRIYTQETKDNIRKGVNKWYETHEGSRKNKKHTIEAKQKMSVGQIKYFETHDAWNKGKKCPQISAFLFKHFETHEGHFKGKKHTEEWKQNQRKRVLGKNNPAYGKAFNAKPYPALYNAKTDKFIPAGYNLTKLCIDMELRYGSMYGLTAGTSKQTRDGWRLATESEIAHFSEI